MLWLVKGEGIGIIGGWMEIENRSRACTPKRFSLLCKENIEVSGLILVLACFLVLLEELLLNVARNELVACKLHRERSTSASD